MFTTRWLLSLTLPAALLIGAAVVGCDDSSSTATTHPSSKSGDPTTSPVVKTTQPTVARPPVKPVAPPVPVETYMSIAMAQGVPPTMVTFPPAKVRLKKSPDGMQAVLYTDDPPEAASKDYRGNSYLFEMELAKVEEADQLDRSQYRYHVEAGSAAADRAVETTNGVFLSGMETHLQPADVVVVFEGRPPQLMAKVMGTFRVVTSDRDGGPAKLAMIQAVLPAIVEASGK